MNLIRYMRKDKNNKNSIFLCGSYHGNNLGDMAILDSTLKSIPAKYKIRILSADPQKVLKVIDIEREVEFVKATSPFQILTAIFKSEHIVIGGGGLFFEKGLLDVLQFWKHSQLLVWVLISFIAGVFNKKVVWLSVGIGPLTGWGKFLIKIALTFVDKVVVRDESSYRILTRTLVYAKCVLGSDIVFLNRDQQKVKQIHKDKKNDNKNIKIGLMLRKGAEGKGGISRFIYSLKETISNCKISVLSTNPGRDDEFNKSISTDTGIDFINTQNLNLNEFSNILSKFDLVISMRMHGLILAYQEGVIGFGIPGLKKQHRGTEFVHKVKQLQKELYQDENLYSDNFIDSDSVEKVRYVIENFEQLREISLNKYKHLFDLARKNISLFE
ncbi:hypothetical protein GF362_06810 [Candidatus Dojkabacteria bacterium]|nr:hypothetical protein [Candidatus Dojkabacteria bacterium]